MKYQMVKLGEICNFFSGNAWSASKFKDNGDIPIIRIQNLGNNLNESFVYWDNSYDDKFLVKKGDMLLSLSGSIKIHIWDKFDALLNQRIVKLTPNKNIDKQWFYWQINYVLKAIEKMGKWALVNNVSITDLKDFQIPLPPLRIQREIAALLDKADALRRKDRELLQAYEALAQAIFMDMFGDPVKNEKDWEVRAFGDLFTMRLGKMLDARKQIGNKKFQYLGNSNVQWFKFNLDNLSEMEFDEKDTKTFELKQDDILICEGGEVGRAAIWNNDMQNVFFQKAIHRARIKTDNITPEFTVILLWFFAKYGGLKDYVTTSTISHLTGEKLKTLLMPLPPYDLQLKFSKHIKSLNSQRLHLENTMNHSESLFQTLLQTSFS